MAAIGDKAQPGKGKSKTGKSSNGKVSGAQGRTPGGESQDPIAMLQADHAAVRKLFEQFDETNSDADKRDLSIAICCALKVHARLEEELFYPAAARVLDDTSLIEEAFVEHAAAKDLIAQIESGAPGEAFFDARVTVLAEYVNHHVMEEEEELFPRFRKASTDLDALGMAIMQRKNELSVGFVASNPVIGLAEAKADANA